MDMKMEAETEKEVLNSLTRAVEAVRNLDSGPAAVSISDLIVGVYGAHGLMRPVLVVIGVSLYFCLKAFINRVCTFLGTSGRSRYFRGLAFIHNILLCLFSFATAVHVWPLTFAQFRDHGVVTTYCSNVLWKNGLGYWGFLFYVSKYWELFDTFLLLVKRRRPSYLQVYHHAMTIVCAYLLQASHATVTFLFVGLNSAVHTLMYAYYASTLLGFKFGAKSVITVLQLAQFVTGIAAAIPMFFMQNGRCANNAQKLAVVAIISHGAYLIKLFLEFYRATYYRKEHAAKDKKGK